MVKGQTVNLHVKGSKPVAASVVEIVGNGPLPKCYKILKVKAGDKEHDNVVYHKDKASSTGKFWSLLTDEIESEKP